MRGPDEMIRAIKRRGGEDARTRCTCRLGAENDSRRRKSDRETNRIPNNAKINASGKDSHWTFVLTVFTDLYSTHAFSFT